MTAGDGQGVDGNDETTAAEGDDAESTPDRDDGEHGTAGRDPLLSPGRKSTLLWGLIGGLTFLVLVQGYELLTDHAVTVGAKAGVALAVFAVATVATTFVRAWTRTR